MLDIMQTNLNAAPFVLLMLLSGCMRSETDFLSTVEAAVRSDPFIVDFRKNMGLEFGCGGPEPSLGARVTGVYLSLHSVAGYPKTQEAQIQAPSVHLIIDCHSAVVDRVDMDLALGRGNVRSFDQFKSITPDMITRIRFEPSDGFLWHVSDPFIVLREPIEPSSAIMSSRIWSGFAAQMSEMSPQGCELLAPSQVNFKDSGATIAHALSYQEFSAVFSCPRQGHTQPGFIFRGLYFPRSGFVLPKEIEAVGAYVN